MVLERIKEYIDNKGISIAGFEKSIGMSNASFGKSLKTGGAIGTDKLENILTTYPDINPTWLLTGKGSMLKQEPTALPVADSSIGVPLVSMEAAAGFGTADFTIKDEDIQNRYLVPDFNGIDFMIRVKGSSMYPKYSSGDVIACRVLRDSKFIQWNKCYVVATREQGLLVKRLKKGTVENSLLAISDNKEYEPFEIPTAEITGIALVIGVIRLE